MQFIPETWIDEAAAQLEDSEEAYEAALQSLEAEQPVLLAYCFTENFEAFTAREREYFLSLLLIVWQAVQRAGGPEHLIDEQQLSDVEEANWSLMHGNKGTSFRSRLDPFFEGYPQEDLLAFAEDALTKDDDEDDPTVSREGQEALFVSLKTLIDCLTQQPS